MAKVITSLQQLIGGDHDLRGAIVQDIDFRKVDINWASLEVRGATFLGCDLSMDDEIQLRRQGAYLYIHPEGIPYNPYRQQLYTWRELMDGYSKEEDRSFDLKIYQHFSKTRNAPSINEALLQRIHDHSIDRGIRELLDFDGEGMTSRRCVGIMGGHSTPRDDEFYRRTALTAQQLTRAGYLVVSGGGPGTMEAANLGAYFGQRTEAELLRAIREMSASPRYTDDGFHQRAFEQLERYPEGAESLAIPTWFYGHEPSNLFASHIAKYFSNSIREDTLLAICLYGIVYAPGSAGTTQEIFQEAAQNHYGTFGYYSPMVFLSERRYAIETSIYPLLRQLSYGRRYHDFLHLTDDPAAVVDFIRRHPPERV